MTWTHDLVFARMPSNWSLPNAHICKNGKCIQTSFAVAKGRVSDVILGTPFLLKIQSFTVDTKGTKGTCASIDDKPIIFEFIEGPRLGRINHINFLISHKEKYLEDLKTEIYICRIEDQFESKSFQDKLANFQTSLIKECRSEIPFAFWHRKKHIVSLPYISTFNQRDIPKKACPSQMSPRLLELCDKEIKDLQKKPIRKSHSPWRCAAFYVQNVEEKERWS